MKRLVAVILVSWSGWVAVVVGAHAAAHQARPHMSLQSTVLYQAAFKTKRLNGWIISDRLSGWHVSRSGVLTNTRLGFWSSLFAPVSTTGIRDYAVEASIQSPPRTPGALAGYGLFVRGQVHSQSDISGPRFADQQELGLHPPGFR